MVKVADYRTHSCEKCMQSPSEVRVQDVLQRPLNVSLTPIERKLQASLAMHSPPEITFFKSRQVARYVQLQYTHS